MAVSNNGAMKQEYPKYLQWRPYVEKAMVTKQTENKTIKLRNRSEYHKASTNLLRISKLGKYLPTNIKTTLQYNR